MSTLLYFPDCFPEQNKTKQMGELTYLRNDDGDLSLGSLLFGILKYSKHI